ncbi:MAG: choice-of-anchor L domain-containing protein [Polyangiales bacterium]
MSSYRSAVGLLFVFLASCSAPAKDSGDEGILAKDSGGGSGDETAPGDEGGVTPEEGGLLVEVGTPEGGGTTCFGADPDCDMDGYPASKDCNDKDGTINPDAYDFKGDMVDNDCDGTVDNPVETCDPSTTSTTPLDFARAADLCPQHSISKKTGKPFDPVASAEFGKAGSSITRTSATKILAKFGDNAARMGGSLFGMQSGPILSADPRGSMAMDLFPVSGACGVIPLNADDCKSLSNGTVLGAASVQDYQEVRMFIRVPSNANAMSFDFAFFSTEFNEYWNSPFNDAFFVIVTGKKVMGQNVAKDAAGKAITVNSGFFQLCPAPPGPSGVKSPAALTNCVGVDGDATKSIFGTLKNTHFDGREAPGGTTDDTTSTKYIYGGGSGWLTTKFAVEPGESMVVRFMVMDTSDGVLDSAAIVDNIRWDKAPPKVPTGEVERPPK